MTCDHPEFQVRANVGRLTDGDGGPVISYTADFRVHCVKCNLPFRFMGLPFGHHYAEPRLSADSQELRAPIEPAYAKEICGMPLVAGNA